MTIAVDHLRKRYGDTPALDGFDLDVPAGTVHALLGPNGAGKTTAVRILATLLRPDGGCARVAGLDVVRRATEVRRRIGLVGQSPALDEALSGRQNLDLFARLHHLGARASARRADELLHRFDLADTGNRPVKHYSGGMKRRLDLAASLILAPAVLFLDEPTTGLDPRGRSEVWAAVRALAEAGTTVLLTTQYLDEADRLADRISVLRDGRSIAEGSPDDLRAMVGGDRIEVTVRHVADLPAVAALLEEPEVDHDRRTVSAGVSDRMAALAAMVTRPGVEDVAIRRPTLDEAFLALVGDR